MRTSSVVRFLVLITLLFALAAHAYAAPKIHYINVGQADAVLLELDKALVLIDAGGETSTNQAVQTHLTNYLSAVFQQRPELHRTIHTVIISHPHIDHTLRLMEVLDAFTVKNLIDGGDMKGSGVSQLKAARALMSENHGRYYAVQDADVLAKHFSNPALNSIHRQDPSVTLKLLSGSRGCDNANNSSLAVLMTYKGAKFIFAGDAEDEGAEDCDAEIPMLIDRYNRNQKLDVDVLKVNHHGSDNGTDEAWLKAVTPKISVISAGTFDPANPPKGAYNTYAYGHPRDSVVELLENYSSDKRPQPLKVMTMDGARKIHPDGRVITNAVYCTCWDGDIVVACNNDGTGYTVSTTGP